MGENLEFTEKLKTAIKEKTDWFNQVQLSKMLENYHLLNTCVRNIYEALVKKALITPDPYKGERKISEISCPDESPYIESERSVIIGARFSFKRSNAISTIPTAPSTIIFLASIIADAC